MNGTAQALPTGHTFTDHDVPEPHEFLGVITKSEPVVKIQCSCGYDGLATIQDGSKVPSCPACIGRAESHQKSLGNAIQEVGKDEVAVQEMVSSAVNKAVGPLMDLIDKLNKQVSEQQATQEAANKKASSGKGGGQ